MGYSLGDHADIVELSGKVMMVAIILLFFVVIFFCCLHLYFKWLYFHRQRPSNTTRRRRRRRLNFSAEQEVVSTPAIGLEPRVLKSIPVIAFNPDEFEDGLECAVCLCEVCDGENARILPKCSHGFHVECIDMWFQSHATCPLCRNPVSNQKSSDAVLDVDDRSSEGPNLPANVLFWGDNNGVNAPGHCMEEDRAASPSSESSTAATAQPSSSSQPEAVVIDIPVQPRNS